VDSAAAPRVHTPLVKRVRRSDTKIRCFALDLCMRQDTLRTLCTVGAHQPEDCRFFRRPFPVKPRRQSRLLALSGISRGGQNRAWLPKNSGIGSFQPSSTTTPRAHLTLVARSLFNHSNVRTRITKGPGKRLVKRSDESEESVSGKLMSLGNGTEIGVGETRKIKYHGAES
jgi:hypothetical protein